MPILSTPQLHVPTHRPGGGRHKPGRRLAALLALGLGLLAAPAGRALAEHDVIKPINPPQYHIQAHLGDEGRTITATVRITLPTEDPRRNLGEVVLLLLPNRFLEPDERGSRRNTAPVPFTTKVGHKDPADPLQPSGFDQGGIELGAVTDAQGHPLEHRLEENQALPVGFTVRDGLLRITLPPAWQGSLEIKFTTRLPERYFDGWSDSGTWTDSWYPVLANIKQGQWQTDPNDPRASRHQLEVTSDSPGWIAAGRAWISQVSPRQNFRMPLEEDPTRSLPLLFFREETKLLIHHDLQLSVFSFFRHENTRIARLAIQGTLEFINHVMNSHRLALPSSRIALLEVDGPLDDITTVGNMVLIPTVYFQNHFVLERIFLARLARALGAVWFGEEVWANPMENPWLHLGLSGYLALDFYTSRFGWDAGIHDIADWLKPRYREHYFEAPIRELIRTGRDLPVMTPLLNNNDLEAARMVSYNKAPLVFRSLAYAVGPGLFQDTLSSFYYMHRHRSIELRDFRATLEGVTGDGYEWFFDRWFYGTSDIDFSIQDWSEKITPEGHVVEVVVRRRPVLPLPVTVALYTADGNRHTQGWNTPEAETTLRFVVPSGTKRVVIDPDEYWLESNRKNNYSEKLFRIRPFFDWSKQREILITLQGLMGGNAIDGNYLGLGMRIQFDEKNSLYLLPIYGERTGLVNYEISWQKSPFIFSGMRGSLSLQHLGGISTHSAGVEYMAYQRGKNTLELGVKLNLEQVEGATYEENGSVIEQPISKADNVTYSLGYSLEPNSQMDTNLFLEFSRSLNSLESDYEFDIFAGYLLQALNAPPNSALLINLLRGATTGETPFQKRFFIGGPEMLRGYPRDPLLSYDEYVGMRMDYRYIFSRKIFGSAYQTRRFTAILSSDVARGWNDGENWRKTTIRRNAGVGLEVMINVLSIVEFPVIMEVSRPIADEEYKDTQIILFGVFSF